MCELFYTRLSSFTSFFDHLTFLEAGLFRDILFPGSDRSKENFKPSTPATHDLSAELDNTVGFYAFDETPDLSGQHANNAKYSICLHVSFDEAMTWCTAQ